MFLIYFVFQFVGYWVQTDWSGDTNQLVWLDSASTSYFQSYKVDGKTYHGQLKLYTPSGIWKTSDTLAKIYQGNSIAVGSSGTIYAGGVGDSARIFKLGLWGDTVLYKKVLTKDWDPGRILSIFRADNGNVLIGTERGDIFLLKNDSIYFKINNPFGKVQAFCQQGVNQIYAGATGGKVYIGTFLGESWDDTTKPIPNTKDIYCIFKASNGSLYACTQSTSNIGQIFKLTNITWTIVRSFSNVEAVYSMCEGPDSTWYISTGPDGKIYKDSCNSWQEIPSPWIMADFYHILCDSTGTIYVGGVCRERGVTKVPQGVIFCSRNEGITWDTFFEYPTGALPTTLRAMTQSKEGFLVTAGDTNTLFISEYVDSGWLASSIYDVFNNQPRANKSLKLRFIHFDCNSGDSIDFRLRSASNIDSMGIWGNNIPNGADPTNYGGAKNGDRYIQYKVKLEKKNSFQSPDLSEVYVKYELDLDGPIINRAALSDTPITWDDFVIIDFNEPTNQPWIETSNIDSILKLNNGHSWRSDAGKGVIKKPGEWLTPCSLKISLSTLKIGVGEGHPPTITIGDTIYPDSFVIKDTLNNPCHTPVRITKLGVSEAAETLSPKLSITPNPFIKSAVIRYELPSKCKVSIKMYNTAGRLIKTLVDGEKEKGIYSIFLQDNNLSKGAYFIKFSINNKIIDIQKLILISDKK